MRPDDLPFVASGWKRSHADAPQNSALAEPKYYDRVNRQFDELQRRPDVSVLVARDPERPDTLFGFVCIEQRGRTLALHYAYTRRSHKRLGVCSELLRAALQGASEADELVYTAGSRFDHVWERWGFKRIDLNDWLRGSVKDLSSVDTARRGNSKAAKTGSVRT